MLRGKLKPLIKYSLFGGIVGGSLLSLHGNQYQLDSIGIVRLGRAAFTVLQIGVIYKKDLYGKGLEKSSSEYMQLKSICHKRSAEKLLDLCCTNKGTYIKVGQHIAALEYLLPKEYVETMKILHCHAPTNKIEDVYKVIKEDLKKDPLEIFLTIEPEPLGTASLAQVHKATLKDGSIVAVKVQHPLRTRKLQSRYENHGMFSKTDELEFKFQWLVDQSKKNIPQELNFVQEGHNAEKIAKLFEDVDWLKVPSVRWDLTTSRVLTMDFVEGGQVNDLKYIQKNNINTYEISDKLGQLYSKMIFIYGFVHSDPHPGNILVKKNDKGYCDVILLDHGLYATLTDEFRANYANLWLSILNRDRKAMRSYSSQLGIEGDAYGLFACMVTGRTWDSILQGIDKKEMSKTEKKFMKQNFTGILPKISEVLQNVDPQMLLVLKTNDLMRGIEHTLRTGTRMGAFCVMSECCVKSVYKQRYKKCNKKIEKVKVSFGEFLGIVENKSVLYIFESKTIFS
ncbi:hypothetical protein NQ317_006758 [Molorchus minor]|uniref:Protein kinase domain-containing protein n=1 Tax=Molorchus minor TaxID=1323400 RepID=A0ABQ9JMJ6_9CUCU|nr:hypothetical protein NQ317_006758 [Molorchus minor]